MLDCAVALIATAFVVAAIVDIVHQDDFFLIEGSSLITNALYLLGAVCTLIGWILLALADAIWIFCYCRVIIIGESGIRQGLVFPNSIRSTDDLEIGQAPLYRAKSANGRFPRRNVLYFVQGEYSPDNLLQTGVIDVWEKCLMKRRFPKRNRKSTVKQTMRTDSEYLLPTAVLWTSYSPEKQQCLKSLFPSDWVDS